MFRRLLNWIRQYDSQTKTPKVRTVDNDAMIEFLYTYPHLTSMKNFRVLQLIGDIKHLERMAEFVKINQKYKDRVRDEEVEALLELIAKMSKHTEIPNVVFLIGLMDKYGYKINEDGNLEKKEGEEPP